MSKNTKGKISYVLQAINILPLLAFGLIIMLFGTHWFTKAMHAEIEVELENSAHNIITLLNVAYPGDYHLEGETAYQLYKGDSDLTGDYELIDRIKKDTELDITLFYQDTRILTTITDFTGTRIIGTGAPNIIIQEVLNTGESRFYDNVIINAKNYFAYYMPLQNSDGSVVGMLFVGKPRSQVDQAVQHAIYPLLIANVLAMILTAICVFFYTKGIASVLIKIHHFLANVSTGNLNAELDSSVLKRNDELGDIGRSALTMQRSLRKMVEHDTLTQLFNRRSGDRKLQQVIEQSSQNHTPFCLAIGDIDFFKVINDTYGHDCGDKVLQNIAKMLQAHMYKYGFAARWGGEEFLLVFDHTNLEESLQILENLLNDIRSMEHKYDNERIKVTMTFGLVGGNTDNVELLIREADEKLYAGKATGRNRIIV